MATASRPPRTPTVSAPRATAVDRLASPAPVLTGLRKAPGGEFDLEGVGHEVADRVAQLRIPFPQAALVRHGEHDPQSQDLPSQALAGLEPETVQPGGDEGPEHQGGVLPGTHGRPVHRTPHGIWVDQVLLALVSMPSRGWREPEPPSVLVNM